MVDVTVRTGNSAPVVTVGFQLHSSVISTTKQYFKIQRQLVR